MENKTQTKANLSIFNINVSENARIIKEKSFHKQLVVHRFII